ncbi:hypothetical protein CN330_18080 [Priestia megaterium]|uniref:DUF3973 domain-containing protein n=1 Tax=Priestia megaterium TaxID=1404 RepID=UPI000BF3A18E|nr:DUF3973 domain-containing protein [Priestia megaterium]PEZ11220.1 hypothetical protein CN330_18080 [Priestia megaterium]WRQ91282.1 DUF3973 domain-containing protein [Priestia megaterium]
MYYCVTCCRLQNENVIKSTLFENGFYIDPFLGEKIPLGMCAHRCNHELCKKKKVIKKIAPKEVFKLKKAIEYLPAHRHDQEKVPFSQ